MDLKLDVRLLYLLRIWFKLTVLAELSDHEFIRYFTLPPFKLTLNKEIIASFDSFFFEIMYTTSVLWF